MAPPFKVLASRQASAQLARIYLRYRPLPIVAWSAAKITSALEKNPQGGQPILKSSWLTITVHPLRATYQVIGDDVIILKYEDTRGP